MITFKSPGSQIVFKKMHRSRSRKFLLLGIYFQHCIILSLTKSKNYANFRWGSTGEVNEVIPAHKLRAIRAEVISNVACLLRFPVYISSSNLCTNVEVGTPCNGDEGSALSNVESDQEKTQIGIFSYQFSLGCDRGWPAVFTRVTFYLDWIEKNSDVVIG